jgi:hypothetical protein
MIPISISQQAAGFPVHSTHLETRFLRIIYIKRCTLLNLLHQPQYELYLEQLQLVYNILLTRILFQYTGFSMISNAHKINAFYTEWNLSKHKTHILKM